MLEGGDGGLGNREHDLVIGTGWSLSDLKTALHVTSQTLSTIVDAVVDHKDRAVTTPADLCVSDCWINIIALLKSQVIIIDVCLIKYVELWREYDKFASFGGDGKVLLIGSPGAG